MTSPTAAPADREQQALGQQQPRHAPARRAERQAHGQLALPRRRAREKQIREIRAGDEQDQADGPEQHERRGPDIPEQRRRPWRRRQPPVLVLRKLRLLGLLDAPGDRVELRVRLRERRVRRKPRQNVELPDVARNGQRIAAPGNPEIGADEHQARRHDADDRRGPAADANRAIEDRGIAAEARLPEAMADDRGRWTVRSELLRREAAAEMRRHADHWKQVVEQERREDSLRHVATRDVAVAEIERTSVREAPARPDVEVFGRRQRLDVVRFGRELRKGDADRHQPIRLRIRKRLEHETVEHAVDETVAADGEPEREDCDRREPRTTNELPERVAQVLEERIHLGPLSRLR